MRQIDIDFMPYAEQITAIIGRVYRTEMTTTSGGNISIRDENGDIWITPSAVDKGSLTPQDVILVKSDGTVVGKHKPSSELPFHRAIYDCRPDIHSIIHAHPPGLVAFSIAHKVPDTNIIPMVKNVCGSVGFAPYALPGSKELGEKIAGQFASGEHHAVIMENHGVVLGGSDIVDAYKRFETLEFCCKTIVGANTLCRANSLTQEQIAEHLSAIKMDIPQRNSTKSTPEEREVRAHIVAIVQRGCAQDLMMGTYGTIAVRLGKDDFLITPADEARWNLMPEDIIRIVGGKAEAGKHPGRLTKLFRRIFQLNSDIDSIISTMSPNIMAHAVSGTKLDVRTIPESWIFLQDVPLLPFGILQNDLEGVAEMFKKKTAILVENDCFIVTGKKLLQPFDYLEVAEFSAHSLVMARALGEELRPITDGEIEDLRIAFNVKK